MLFELCVVISNAKLIITFLYCFQRVTVETQEEVDAGELLPVVIWFIVSECPVPAADRWFVLEKIV